MHAPWFRLFRFRSPLLTESIFFLFLCLLRCFSSAGSLHMAIYSPYDTSGSHLWVSPFRHPRIISYLPIPVAFRSLLRLSSALSAKASTLRSCLLTIYASGLRSPLTRVCSVIPPAVLDLFISIWCVNTFLLRLRLSLAFMPPASFVFL